MNNLYYVIGAGVLAMFYAFWKTGWINSQDEGTDRMKQIGANIADGAMAFLKAEYRVLAIFIIIVAVLLAFAANANRQATITTNIASTRYSAFKKAIAPSAILAPICFILSVPSSWLLIQPVFQKA